jgi:hypothetical protein
MNTDYWQQRRNTIHSQKGKWVGGEDVQVGEYSMMQDLLGKISYMQMMVLNITGRLINENLAKWLEGNFIGMSYPDSRIWCNQVGALCGTLSTSVTAATTAGVLAADSRAYGGSKTSLLASNFIQQALSEYQQGHSVEDIIQSCVFKNGKPVITGFARPIARTDERIQPHINMTESLGFKTGKHLDLAFQLSDYLDKHYGLGINIGGYTCAFLSDQGFTGTDIYRIKALVVASGVTACYLDSLNSPEHSFLPLRCDDIDYQGSEIRTLPE